MGRIAKIEAKAFNAIASQVKAINPNEANFCSVASLAAACKVPVEAAYEAMKAQGRKDGQGASMMQIRAAARSLGFDMRPSDSAFLENKIAQYPGVHKNLKGVTTHHPRRFAKAWAGVTGIFYCVGHVAAVVDGELADWTVNSSKRVIMFYHILPIEA